MSKRGPKPKPTRILRLHGSRRAASRHEPEQFAQKRPPCPRRFILKQKDADAEAVRAVAQSTWKRLSAQLWNSGLLIDSFFMRLETLCDSWGRYLLACKKCDTEGMTADGSAGNKVRSPWFAIRNEMYEQVCKDTACFGLTPADLSGVRSLEKPAKDEGKARFFKEA